MERDVSVKPLLSPLQAGMGWGVWVERLAVNPGESGELVNGEGWQDAAGTPRSQPPGWVSTADWVKQDQSCAYHGELQGSWQGPGETLAHCEPSTNSSLAGKK